MKKPVSNTPSFSAITDSLKRRAGALAAGVLAPIIPEHYYRCYRERLSETLSHLPTIESIAPVSMESDFQALYVQAPGKAGEALPFWDAVSAYTSSHLLVVGAAGSGKSALLQRRAWEMASRDDEPFKAFARRLTFKVLDEPVDHLLPILIDLDEFARGSGAFLRAILKTMARNGFPKADEYVTECLTAGRCLLLLDGLECVRDAARRTELERAIQEYPKNLWIVSSRPDSVQVALKGFVTLDIRGIAQDDVDKLARVYLEDRSQGVSRVLAACERDEMLASLATNPLMLEVMCRQTRTLGSRDVTLPLLYEACLQLLLYEWPHSKRRATSKSPHELHQLLQHLALDIEYDGHTELSRERIATIGDEVLDQGVSSSLDDVLDDLARHTGVLATVMPGGDRYAFASPALQHYLAAERLAAEGHLDALRDHIGETRCAYTIALAAALLPDPLPLLLDLERADDIESPYKWFLLAKCIAEIPGFDDSLVDRVTNRLDALLEDDAQETHWKRAAIAIAGMSRRTRRAYYSTLSRDPDAAVRCRALLTLGRLGEDWSIPALGSAISDKTPQVSQRAAWALGRVPSIQSVRILTRALRSSVEGMRTTAADALANLGRFEKLCREVVRDLIRALGDDNKEVAMLAEDALGRIGQPALDQLKAAMDSPRIDSDERGRIARSLGRLGEEDALPILIEALLTGPNGEQDAYVEAISGLGGVAVPALIGNLHGRDVTSGAGLVAALVSIGGPAVPSLIEAMAGDAPEVRNAAERTLERIGEPSLEPLTYSLLHDGRFEIRRRSLNILGRIGEDYAVSALIEALDDPDEGVLSHAVRHLGSFGDPQAVEPLIAVLERTEQTQISRGAIASLGALRDSRAVQPLIAALDSPSLREPAASALEEMGRDAIEPLVRLLHEPATRADTQEAAWDVLGVLGANAHPDEENPYGLAHTYSILRNEDLSPAEVLATLDNVRWWQYGNELIRSMQMAHTLAETRAIGEISEQDAPFEWMLDVAEWLRPHMKEILWGFKDIVENIKLYRTLTRRDSQRDALLSSIDRLEELHQRTIDTTLPFERRFIERVISNWRTMIFDTTKQLRGRASLMITLRTRRLPLRASQRTTIATFEVFNEGESVARNLRVKLRSASRMGNGLDVVTQDLNLDPLGIGQVRQINMTLAPNGVLGADLVLDAFYDDDESENNTKQTSHRIDFDEVPSEYTPIEANPYVVGMPVKTSAMFYGRQDIFGWIRENISSQYQEQSLILYGERRMGKTSVLYQLQREPPTPQHVCLLFDLQLRSYIVTVFEFLYELASEIAMKLADVGVNLDEPDWDEFEAHPQRAFRQFCDHMDENIGERRVLVMMDEFGVLMDKVSDGTFDKSLFDFLRGILQRTRTLSFLFTGAYEIRRMQQDYGSILFNMPKVRKITYLTEAEATALITEPVKGLITYHPSVINQIHAVTACHPYFIQYICEGLVQLARAERRNYIELTDLDYVIQEVVQDATGNIENSIYGYLNDHEKIVLAALGNVTDDVRVYVPVGDIASLLDRRGLGMPRDEIMSTLKALEERDLVTEMRIGQQLRYSFRMGLVRRWLRQNEILLRISQERES